MDEYFRVFFRDFISAGDEAEVFSAGEWPRFRGWGTEELRFYGGLLFADDLFEVVVFVDEFLHGYGPFLSIWSAVYLMLLKSEKIIMMKLNMAMPAERMSMPMFS